MRHSLDRKGITLIELLIVISLIAILMAMLMPAVNSARESARRSQCSNHIKQLALASINYESAFGRFPPGIVSTTDDFFKAEHSGFVYLLPFLDETELYERYDFDRRWISRPNRMVAAEGPSVFLCPSNSSGISTHGSFGTSPLDYAFCKGSNAFIADEAKLTRLPQGIFGINSKTRYRDILDGSSRTLAFGEAASNPNWKAKSTCG